MKVSQSKTASTRHTAQALAIGLFFLVFLVYPLSTVLLGAFVVDGAVSPAFFFIMVTSPNLQESLLNSLNIAAVVTLLVTALAYPLALVMTRVQLRYQNLLHALLLLPLVLPPFVGALGIRQLLSRFGTINVVLLDLGLITRPLDLLSPGSPWGVISIQSIHLLPITYLYLRASLAGVPAVLEESARLCGATRLQIFRTILLPLTTPAAISAGVLVFVSSLTDVGTPLLFEYRRSLPVEIYNMLTDLHENRVGFALVSSVALLCLALFAISHSQSAKFLIEQSARTERNRKTGLTRGPLLSLSYAFVIGVAAVGVVPHIFLVLTAIADRWIMTALPASFTFEHFQDVFHNPLTYRAITNSLFLSSASTAGIVLLGFGVAYLRWRTRTPGRVALEFMSLTPLAIPGLVFAFGYLGAFSGTFLDARINPIPLLIAAYIIRRLPPMVRASSTGLREASTTLEEAGLTLGGSKAFVTRTITIPLVARHLLAGAILAFAFSMLEVSDSLLLAIEERYYPVSKAMYAMVSRPDGAGIAAALGVFVSVILGGAFWLSTHLARDKG